MTVEPDVTTTATTPPAAATPPDTKPVTPPTAPPAAKHDSEPDEEGDWLSESGLTANQQKFIRKLMTEKKNKAEALKLAQEKVSDYEKKQAEEQRKRDEEQGNWKKIAEETAEKLKAKDLRIMRESVRNHAIKEGIVDPDLIDLLPLDGVSLDDAGEVIGADKFVAKFKKDKAYLFGELKSKEPEGTTTTKATPAPNTTATPKDCLSMDDNEFAVAVEKFKKDNR